MTHIMTPEGAGSGTPESGEAPSRDESAQGFRGQGKRDNSDCAHAAEQCKRLATLTARAALRGVVLHSIDGDDGRPLYIASRWALTKSFGDLGEVDSWLDRIGAPG